MKKEAMTCIMIFVEDDNRRGRPSKSRSHENYLKVYEFLNSDRC